jgi:hypothetical protein
MMRPGDHPVRPSQLGGGLVEGSLRARGIAVSTDGTPHGLHAFVAGRFPRIAAGQTRAGDVIFFDLGDGCGGHAGVVETIESDGRIGFREWRDGTSRHSLASLARPLSRRDERGRVLNTFLRPKRPTDASDTRYFAGDMLCAAYRVDG